MTKNVNESGRTMLEMLGVLAIMGVIMYGAIAGISFGVDMYQINATYNQIEEISEGIVDLYSWSRSYKCNSDELQTEVCKNDITDCYRGATPTIKSPLGGSSVLVIGSDPSAAGCDGFEIKYVGLTYLACVRLRDEDGTKYRHVTCSVDSATGAGCSESGSNTLVCHSR